MNFVRIEGFPNYVIHPCGTILRIWSHKTKEMKTYKTSIGYMAIGLHKNGKEKKFKHHRLLALAFIPNPENKPCVDHINGVRDDNNLDNLRWLTQRENLNAFRRDRGVYSIITKGGIYKTKYGWQWQYLMSGKEKSKTMKSKEDLEKFRKEKLAEYNIYGS